MLEIPRLGERGGGWVVLQFALMVAILVLGVAGPGWPDGARWWVKGAGAVLVFGGTVVFVSATRALGSGLTPFPRPADAADLVETGPYAVVRHPIYAGGILFFAGVSLALSLAALVATGVLALVWALKAQVEERFLRAENPRYDAYCERTRFRLIPFVY